MTAQASISIVAGRCEYKEKRVERQQKKNGVKRLPTIGFFNTKDLAFDSLISDRICAHSSLWGSQRTPAYDFFKASDCKISNLLRDDGRFETTLWNN